MRKLTLMAALAVAAWPVPVLLAAQADALTIAFFQNQHLRPRDAAALRATVLDRTLVIRTLKSGTIERVYYGARRIDAKNARTNYRIADAGIREDHDGVQRVLLVYDWQGSAYVCVDNVGELDDLGEAAGTCPYQIVSTIRGNHVGEK
jgi:hypothetical protein